MSSDDVSDEGLVVTSVSDVPEAHATSDPPSDPEPRRVRIVVAVPSLPASLREKYEDVHSNVVESVVEEVAEAKGGDVYYQIEFRDGRHDIVSSFALWPRDLGADLPINRYPSKAYSRWRTARMPSLPIKTTRNYPPTTPAV